LKYRSEEDFEDFLEYNDLGLPIAYAIANDIVKPLDLAKSFVDETFDLLLVSLGIEDDNWENLDQMLSISKGL
jgi:hypothetical protein